jgi:hypothetical protein
MEMPTITMAGLLERPPPCEQLATTSSRQRVRRTAEILRIIRTTLPYGFTVPYPIISGGFFQWRNEKNLQFVTTAPKCADPPPKQAGGAVIFVK